MKKIISLFLTTLLVLSMCSVPALAADVYTPVTVEGGEYGPSTIVEDMVLDGSSSDFPATVSGTTTTFNANMNKYADDGTEGNASGSSNNITSNKSSLVHKNLDYVEVTYDITFSGKIGGDDRWALGLGLKTFNDNNLNWALNGDYLMDSPLMHTASSTMGTHSVKIAITYGATQTTVTTYVDGVQNYTGTKDFVPAADQKRGIGLTPYQKLAAGEDKEIDAATTGLQATISNLDIKEYCIDAQLQEFSSEYTLADNVNISYNVPAGAESAELKVAGKKAARVTTSGYYVTTVDLSEFIGFWGKVPVELYVDGVLAKSSYFVVNETPATVSLGTENFDKASYSTDDMIIYDNGSSREAIKSEHIDNTDILGNSTGKFKIHKDLHTASNQALFRKDINEVYDDIKNDVFEFEFDACAPESSNVRMGILTESYYVKSGASEPTSGYYGSKDGYVDGWSYKRMSNNGEIANTTKRLNTGAWTHFKISLNMKDGKFRIYNADGVILDEVTYKPNGISRIGLAFNYDSTSKNANGLIYIDNLTFSKYSPATAASVESVSVDDDNDITIAFDKAFADSVDANEVVSFSQGDANASFSADRKSITISPVGNITAADALVTIDKTALGSGADMVIPVSFKEFMGVSIEYNESSRTYTGTVHLKTGKTGNIGKIYMAVYNGDALEDVVTEDIVVTSSDDVYTCPYTMPEDASYTVKMFVWDANLTPYVDVVD